MLGLGGRRDVQSLPLATEGGLQPSCRSTLPPAPTSSSPTKAPQHILRCGSLPGPPPSLRISGALRPGLPIAAPRGWVPAAVLSISPDRSTAKLPRRGCRCYTDGEFKLRAEMLSGTRVSSPRRSCWRVCRNVAPLRERRAGISRLLPVDIHQAAREGRAPPATFPHSL